MMQVLLVTICLAVFPYQGSSIILESGNVNDYEIVYPQKLTALHKGAIQQPEQKYEDAVQYEFEVNGEPVVLHLEKNKDLFSEDYSETHYSPDGREITTNPPVQDHCYYHGRIQTDAHSSASISACNGLKGYFKLRGEMYLIEPLKIPDSEAHAVYKYENIEKEDETPKMCGVTQTNWESDEPIKKASQLVATSEQQRYYERYRYVKIILVLDHRMMDKYEGNLRTLKRRMYQLINYLNEMYFPWNIRVPLVGMEFWNERDLINVTSSPRATLDLFGEWRESDLLIRRSHDYAQLVTAIDFDGPTIGMSNIATMCHSKLSVAVVEDYRPAESVVAAIMAHEMGHNLGIIHDENPCTCGASSCIMNSEIGDPPPVYFSNCSWDHYQKFLTIHKPDCILIRPSKTDIISPPVCGNDLLEKGEECDCGSPEKCQDPCCDAALCKKHSWIECEIGECCDQCRLKPAGTECRAIRSECDLPEYCTGQSVDCPIDDFYRNGKPCQNNNGYCYKGFCPMMHTQCYALFGPEATVAHDGCFQLNEKGTGYFSCGKENDVTIPCKPEDVKCGRLFCEIVKNTCKYDYSPDPNYGMVDEGTKCEDGKVCKKRHCVDVTTAY